MKLALDVQYDDAADSALAAGVIFRGWADSGPTAELLYSHVGLEPYAPGQFFRRELPCVLPLIARARETWPIHTIIVDSYVDLGESAGLGRHVFNALNGEVAVIGVAKTRYSGSTPTLAERGSSRHPLYITATGDPEMAAQRVLWMHGDHRIPTLLRQVDQLARGLRQPA